jgi:predicted CopG family antitoxin
MKKTITIKLETWQQLTRIKVDLNLESLDAVIKELLKKWKTQ